MKLELYEGLNDTVRLAYFEEEGGIERDVIWILGKDGTVVRLVNWNEENDMVVVVESIVLELRRLVETGTVVPFEQI